MSPEFVLMWSAAIILAAVALAAAALAFWFAVSTVHGCLMRYRVHGLTRDQIHDCVQLAARYRRENLTSGGPVSPPVDPVMQPRRRNFDPEEES
jgi:hypothetical protein